MFRIFRTIVFASFILLISFNSTASTTSTTEKTKVANDKLASLLLEKGYNLVHNTIEIKTAKAHQLVNGFFGSFNPEKIDYEYVTFTAEKDGQKFRGWLYMYSVSNFIVDSAFDGYCSKMNEICIRDSNSGKGVLFKFTDDYSKLAPGDKSIQDLHLRVVPTDFVSESNSRN